MKSINNSILVIDDDEIIQSFLKKKLPLAGYSVTTVSTAEAALHRITDAAQPFALILSDIMMPKMTGIELLTTLKQRDIRIPVILMTAHGKIETAIQSMRDGAFDYILKPIHIEDLKLSIERAFQFKRLESDNETLRNEMKQSWKSYDMIGKSHVIQSIFEVIARVAPTQANVLITGESGTGKELIARALHKQSIHNEGPFVPINCSAIPAELLESELFGHAKGSFTGAHQAKKGLFEAAEGGTLFLDEIGEMEPSLQAKLLRVLQERTIKPVGENQSRPIHVRVISATHQNLKLAIQENRFREDLFYRLCVIPIELPALRQRKDDIPLLAEYFLKKYSATHSSKVTHFTQKGMAKLINHAWPGNIRELENVIERSVILASTPGLDETDLPPFEGESQGFQSLLEEKAAHFLSLEKVERHYIQMILRRTGGKKERAAQVLGIDRKTLRRKMREEETLETEVPSQ